MTLIIENSGQTAGIENLWDRYSSCPDRVEFMALAEQLRRGGCQGQAAEICTRAKASFPRYVSCRVLLGRCLMELGLREQALKELEEVLELDRENAISLRAMAELRMAQGKLSEAANYYRALVRINPADLEMQEKLAQVVRALEPTNGDANLPVGQEAVVRPTRGTVSEIVVRPASQGIEAAVDRALEELRAPEALVPAWHLEDQVAGTTPAQAAPVSPRAVRPAPEARPEARGQGRSAALSFNYSNRRSDFSTFAQWVERERGGARK